MKEAIKKYLGIKEQKDWSKELTDAVEIYRKEATVEFERIINQLQPVICINDGKIIIKGRDSVYTNSKGQNFCSHECIDQFVEKRKVK